MPSSAATSSRPDETAYDRHRLRQWLAGEARADGVSRRRLLTLLAAAGTAGALPLSAPVPARAADGDTIVKPLPPETFVRHGTNAETRWEALRGIGHHTPNDLFFVRNHTATPRVGADDWRLKLWGSGLRGGPGEDRPVEFGYDDLRRLPSVTRTAFVECAGNGRSGFTTQQGETVSGTPWGLGAIGVARWRGVPCPPCCAARACPRTPSTCSRAVWTPSTSAAGRVSAGYGGRCRCPRPCTTSCSPTR